MKTVKKKKKNVYTPVVPDGKKNTKDMRFVGHALANLLRKAQQNRLRIAIKCVRNRKLDNTAL